MAPSTMAFRNMLGLASCLVLILISQTSGAKIKLCIYSDDSCSKNKDYCSLQPKDGQTLFEDICAGLNFNFEDLLESNGIGSGLTNTDINDALLKIEDECVVIETPSVSCADFEEFFESEPDALPFLGEFNKCNGMDDNYFDILSYKTTCEEEQQKRSGKKLTDAEIVGIVFVAIAGAALVFGGIYYGVKKSKLMKRKETPEASRSLL